MLINIEYKTTYRLEKEGKMSSFYLYFTDTQLNVGPFPSDEMEDVFSSLRKKCRVFMRFDNSLASKQIRDMVVGKQHGAIVYEYREQSMDFATLEEYYSVEETASCPFMLLSTALLKRSSSRVVCS